MEFHRRMEQVQQELQQEIVGTACGLFLAQGIEPIKMTDVAAAANVGVASLYRWFGTKKELVILAGIHLWKQVAVLMDGIFTSAVYQQKDGLAQCADLLKLFFAAFTGHPDYIRFLSEFDRFAAKEGIAPEELAEYETSILDLQPLARSAWEKGLGDGTIRPGLDFETFYFSATHALMALAQKLVCTGSLLSSDSRVSGEKQMQAVVDMFVSYLKA